MINKVVNYQLTQKLEFLIYLDTFLDFKILHS